MQDDFYQQGYLAYSQWMHSPSFAWMSRDLPARDVMRLFLPPVPEDMMQVQRPLPKNYQEWLRGFNQAKEEGR